jgi:hypothetical protein
LKLRSLFYILIVSLLLSSCGYLDDEPVKDARIVRVDDLKASCVIDTERIKNLFAEIITDDLSCVESKLEKFKFIRSVNPEILSEEDIQKFVRKYFTNNPDAIIDGLGLLFKLNSLLLKDTPGTMSRKNIKPFFVILKDVNIYSVQIINLIDQLILERDVEKFALLHDELEAVIQEFSQEIYETVSTAPGAIQTINIENLIIELTKNLDGFKLGRELLNSLLFAKKLFLGGSREYITTAEATRLFKLLPVYAMNAVDVFIYREDLFESTEKYFENLALNLERLKQNIYEHQDETVILDINDIERIIDEFITEDGNALTKTKIKELIRSFKRDLVGGDEIEFSYRDVEISLAFINIAIRSFEKISSISDLLKDIEDKDFNERIEIKTKFLNNINELSLKIKELVENNQDIPTKMRLLKFLESVISEDNNYFKIDPQLLNSFFSLKVASVGGTREETTIPELLKALDSASAFATLYYDLQYLSEYYFDLSPISKYEFFEIQINRLKDILLKDQEIENVITVQDLNIIIDQFYKDPQDQLKSDALKKIIINVKDNILRVPGDDFSLRDIKTSADMALILMKSIIFMRNFDDLQDKFEKGEISVVEAHSKYMTEFAKVNQVYNDTYANPKFATQTIKMAEFLEKLDESKDVFDVDAQLLLKGSKVKSIFLGGENELITREEMVKLGTILTKFSQVLFDLTFTDFDDDNSKKETYRVMLTVVRNLQEMISPNPEQNNLTVKEALDLGQEIIIRANRNSNEPKDEDDLININNFKRTIIDLTERLLDPIARKDLSYPSPCQPDPANPGKYICSQDDPPNSDLIDIVIRTKAISKLLHIANEGLQALYFGEVTYDYFEDKLQERTPVKIDFFPDLPEYRAIDGNFIVRLKRSFAHIAKEFRYFRNKDNFSFYQRSIVRHKNGYTSLMLMRYVLGHALFAYGTEGNNEDPETTAGIEVHQLNDTLVGMKSVLDELGLWTTNFETFGQNILLLGDLFQTRSNGDLKINLDEASEFVEMLFTSATLSGQLLEKLNDICSVTTVDEGEIEVETNCVRRNFFNILFGDDQLDLDIYFPRLKLYVDTVGKAEAIEYIKGVEGFARDVEDLNIPWNKRDFTLVLGAMLNIESTFLRFDTVYNNYLNFDELMKSLKIYNNAIILLAKLEGNNKKLSRTVFFYMVKYMKAPSPVQVFALDRIFKWHFGSIQASRLNISKLLFYLVNAEDVDSMNPPDDKKRRANYKNHRMNSLGKEIHHKGQELANKPERERRNIFQRVIDKLKGLFRRD